MIDHPSIVFTMLQFLNKLLKWKSYVTVGHCGLLSKFEGFAEFNFLVDINSIFSNLPKDMPRDRTQTVRSPVNLQINRPWVAPTEHMSLNESLSRRVASLTMQNQKINIFWSGGVDSTTMLTAFLKHSTDLQQLRILYSPYSTYEHPEYLKFLSKFNIELVDISGEIYLNHQFDGVFLTGEGGDELHASLDQSFITKYGVSALYRPWREFFRENGADSKLIEFCEKYFAISNRPIDTVLEARWWFYASCKNYDNITKKLLLFTNYTNFNINIAQGFFDCAEYECFIYWNLDKIITTDFYSGWRKILKQYCFEFDSLEDWYINKEKTDSKQLNLYANKNSLLKNIRPIFILEDNSIIQTPNLPLLSRLEFERQYGTTLDYLFNEPN